MATYGRSFSSSSSGRSSGGPSYFPKNADGCTVAYVTSGIGADRWSVGSLEANLGIPKLPIIIVDYPNKGPYMFRKPKGVVGSLFNKGVEQPSELITACDYDDARTKVNERYNSRGLSGKYYVTKLKNKNGPYVGMTLEEISNYLKGLNPSDPKIENLNKIVDRTFSPTEEPWTLYSVLGLVVIPEGKIDSETKTPMPPGLAYQITLQKSSGGRRKTKKRRTSRRRQRKTRVYRQRK